MKTLHLHKPHLPRAQDRTARAPIPLAKGGTQR